MAKAIIRFGIAGERRAAQTLSIKDAADMMQHLTFVYMDRQGEVKKNEFCVSRNIPRIQFRSPNGFWVEVQYVPSTPKENAGA